MTECMPVTVGAGYIGSVVASQFLAREYEVVVLVAHSRGYREDPLHRDDT